jgi:hypothetical protein
MSDAAALGTIEMVVKPAPDEWRIRVAIQPEHSFCLPRVSPTGGCQTPRAIGGRSECLSAGSSAQTANRRYLSLGLRSV